MLAIIDEHRKATTNIGDVDLVCSTLHAHSTAKAATSAKAATKAAARALRARGEASFLFAILSRLLAY